MSVSCSFCCSVSHPEFAEIRQGKDINKKTELLRVLMAQEKQAEKRLECCRDSRPQVSVYVGCNYKWCVEYDCMSRTLLSTACNIINDFQATSSFFGSYFVKFLKLIWLLFLITFSGIQILLAKWFQHSLVPFRTLPVEIFPMLGPSSKSQVVVMASLSVTHILS